MNNHINVMDDKSDQFIQQCIKNWATQQNPPKEIRARVLFAASPFYRKLFYGNNIKSGSVLDAWRWPILKQNDVLGQTQLVAWYTTLTSMKYCV